MDRSTLLKSAIIYGLQPNRVVMWMGRNGEYVVPEAISWLGSMANLNARLPVTAWPACWKEFQDWERSPYFKIVEEWGNWRDAQEEVSERQQSVADKQH